MKWQDIVLGVMQFLDQDIASSIVIVCGLKKREERSKEEAVWQR